MKINAEVKQVKSLKDFFFIVPDYQREYVWVKEKKELLKIIKDLLYEYSIQNRKKTPRLELQYEDSKDFLLKLIEDNNYTDKETNSIKRMRDAYKTVSEFLNEFKSSDISILISFIRYFLVNVEMVIIQPDDIGSALKIFETINERGVGLNAMDLLKNLL